MFAYTTNAQKKKHPMYHCQDDTIPSPGDDVPSTCPFAMLSLHLCTHRFCDKVGLTNCACNAFNMLNLSYFTANWNSDIWALIDP